jgi:hypothetical protein
LHPELLYFKSRTKAALPIAWPGLAQDEKGYIMVSKDICEGDGDGKRKDSVCVQ